jgi:hypothetical protein
MTEENMPAAQMSLIKPEIAPTDDAKVDAALARLGDVANLPVSEHLEVFEEVHRRLQDVLSETHE